MDDLSIEELLMFLHAERRALRNIARDLRRPRGWFFNWREHMSTASTRVDAITAQLDAIANQFPPAVGAAITKAHDAGVAEGQAQGAADPDIGPALDKLDVQIATTTAVLQASIAPPVAQPDPTAGA